QARSERQVDYSPKPGVNDAHTAELPLGPRGRPIYLTPDDKVKAEAWLAAGFTEGLKTPDSTVVFETPETSAEVLADQQGCMGCLSQCRFSNWHEGEEGTTGKRADPRSFCIQKTLQSVAHGGDIDNNLMFSGHNAYMFGKDPFYADGFVPTVQQLVDRIIAGD
ncbi:MAG: nitronate monooxygenase, partial [Rhodospirillaceae bacterium]|nr:nitronate monooxygenase [Rhodospirillaceae bacterium]